MAHFSNICRPLHLLNFVTNGKYLIQPPANFLKLAETEQFCVSVSENDLKKKTKKERKREIGKAQQSNNSQSSKN